MQRFWQHLNKSIRIKFSPSRHSPHLRLSMFLLQRSVKSSVSLRLARAGGYMRIGAGSLGEAGDS